jgi:GntR family transcriptional regulator
MASDRQIIGTDEPGDSRPEFQPLYLQIKQLLIQRVLTGKWRPGQLLPSEMKLAAEYRVAQGTVRKALEEMAAENLVVRHQGKGTFVATHSNKHRPFRFIRLVADKVDQRFPSTKFLSVKLAPASAIERQKLELGPGAKVVRVERLRSYGEQPCVVERIALRTDGFAGLKEALEAVQPDSIYSLLEQNFGMLIVRIHEQLRAVPADAGDARLLAVKRDAPLLEVDRVAFSLDQRRIEWRFSRCDTRFVHYAIDLT